MPWHSVFKPIVAEIDGFLSAPGKKVYRRPVCLRFLAFEQKELYGPRMAASSVTKTSLILFHDVAKESARTDMGEVFPQRKVRRYIVSALTSAITGF